MSRKKEAFHRSKKAIPLRWRLIYLHLSKWGPIICLNYQWRWMNSGVKVLKQRLRIHSIWAKYTRREELKHMAKERLRLFIEDRMKIIEKYICFLNKLFLWTVNYSLKSTFFRIFPKWNAYLRLELSTTSKLKCLLTVKEEHSNKAIPFQKEEYQLRRNCKRCRLFWTK